MKMSFSSVLVTLPDPVKTGGNEAEKRAAFNETYQMLNNRISIFANLLLDQLDKLNEIGDMPRT